MRAGVNAPGYSGVGRAGNGKGPDVVNKTVRFMLAAILQWAVCRAQAGAADAPRLLSEPQKGIYETQIANGGILRLVTQTGGERLCKLRPGIYERV